MRQKQMLVEKIEESLAAVLPITFIVLAIVATHRDRNAILEAVEHSFGLRTEAQATVISLPIDHTARLD